MARPNEHERRPASLKCVRGHRYVDNSVPQVGMYVAEQDEPTWRIDATDLRCRVCSSEIDPSRSQPL